jgi:ABC-type glycerol-3-phosphate transport system permease component
MISRRKVKAKRIARTVVLALIALIANFPVLTVILNSLRSTADIMASSDILPTHATLQNYVSIVVQSNFLIFFRNSLIVALSGTFVSIIVAGLAGYAMSRFHARFLRIYGSSLLALQMFPVLLVLIPLFVLFRILGLIDTYWSVILLYITGNLPFATWMYRGFFDSIPKELEESSWIDGCSRLQSFVRIALPLSGPGVAAVGIFSFLFSWNEYLIAMVFLRNNARMTIPVGLQLFMQQYQTDWGSLFAAATLAMLPPLLFSFFAQKYMVYGAVAGAVKG